MLELAAIFCNVIMPVFGIVLIGYLLGRRLSLQAQTLTRVAYYVFVPAFIFQAISHSGLALAQALKLLCFIVLAHLLVALLAGGTAWLLGRPKAMIAAFIMVAVSGNVGNYGLAMVRFRLGEAALAPATIYYVAVSITLLVVSVGAAGWAHGGGSGALGRVLRTPAIWAAVPALLVANGDVAIPLMLARMIGLLADAMIPVMLFSLGLQLLEQQRIHCSLDVVAVSAFRLLLAPALAMLVAIPFDLGALEYSSGVLQSGMPVAIMAAIVAREHDIVPAFVTSVVLFSLLASLVTLPLLMLML